MIVVVCGQVVVYLPCTFLVAREVHSAVCPQIQMHNIQDIVPCLQLFEAKWHGCCCSAGTIYLAVTHSAAQALCLNAGKTSLIKAIANMTGRHIISVSLEAIHTKRQLKHLFQNEDVHVASADGSGQPEIFRIPIGRRLFVLEDIDAASQLVLDRKYQKPVSAPAKAAAGAPKTREEWQRHYADANGGAEEEDEEEDDDALNLATLLNLLDGSESDHLLRLLQDCSLSTTPLCPAAVEYPGRIVIMTSNYPERLDKALVRKGRVDLSLRFKKASRAITEEMYENFFDEPWPRACSPLDYEYTPAEVSAILYNNFDAPANAVRDLTARVPAGGDKNAATVVPAAVPEHISDEMRIKRAFGLAA